MVRDGVEVQWGTQREAAVPITSRCEYDFIPTCANHSLVHFHSDGFQKGGHRGNPERGSFSSLACAGEEG